MEKLTNLAIFAGHTVAAFFIVAAIVGCVINYT